jgi:hypothetical protein
MAKAMALFLLVLVILGWLILKPGTFFVPPSSYEPKGVILLYYEKSSAMPFFSSPETLCLAQFGERTTTCLEKGESTLLALSRRQITRLPYADWAYQLFLPQQEVPFQFSP